MSLWRGEAVWSSERCLTAERGRPSRERVGYPEASVSLNTTPQSPVPPSWVVP
jgi:hypothetical protein